MTIQKWRVAVMILSIWGTSCEGTSPTLQTTRVATNTTRQHTLKQHQWKHRLLIIFAPSAKNPIANAQTQLAINDLKSYRARHLRVYLITPQKTLYMSPQDKQWRTETVQIKGGPSAWRRALSLKEDKKTHVILVGKDGGSKRRTQQAILTNKSLFSTIDAMPMRQQEMQRQHSSKSKKTRQ